MAEFKGVRDMERGKSVILDQTIFYPQGGGQPSDHGEIHTENGVFKVTDVRLDEDGVVHHFGAFTKGNFSIGETVQLRIDIERRVENAKIHSAGHLLDIAVGKVGISDIKATKGYHFPNGPYVEYEGTLENPQEFIPKLEEAIKELIAKDIEVEKKDLLPEEAERRGLWAPPGKSVRTIGFKGYNSCGCGGTHVRSTGEIGKVKVRKISSKKGKVRISYLVE